MSLTFSFGKWYAASLIAGFAIGMPALANDPSGAASGLATALEQAWRRHPQAAALDAREAAVIAARDRAAGLTPEPGSVSIGNLNDRFNRNAGRQEWEVELATPLWLPGQRAAREAEAASHVDEATAKRAALRLELAGEVREAWWALAAARNATRLASRRVETARALEADVRRRHAVGELSRIDANLAKTETHLAEAESIEADAAQFQAEQALRTLTGAATPVDLREEIPAVRETTATVAESPERHPQLLAAAAAARSARASVKVAEASRRAAPELALRVVRERGDFAEPYANSVGIRLKIPFSSAPQTRRETSSAQAEAEQADADLRRMETRILFDIDRARRALQANERQLTMGEERLLLSAENLRLSEKAFSLGESDLASLLRIRAAAFDADAFLDRQRVARAAAQSRLKQSLGVLP